MLLYSRDVPTGWIAFFRGGVELEVRLDGLHPFAYWSLSPASRLVRRRGASHDSRRSSANSKPRWRPPPAELTVSPGQLQIARSRGAGLESGRSRWQGIRTIRTLRESLIRSGAHVSPVVMVNELHSRRKTGQPYAPRRLVAAAPCGAPSRTSRLLLSAKC